MEEAGDLIIPLQNGGINQATRDLKKFEGLYNTMLDIRRSEKNVLLNHDQENLKETRNLYHRARRQLSRLADTAGIAGYADKKRKLVSTLRANGDNLSILEEMPAHQTPDEAVQENIRVTGEQMVDLSHELLESGNHRVTVVSQRALHWPVISLGLTLLIFIVGVALLNRKVIRPLENIEQATTKIGRGDFGPIHHTARIESEVDHLILAFNRMAEELEARQEQIVHSRKIASLGTLVSGVAHELNNPINNIILTVDSLVGSSKITDERRRSMLNDILNQAVRASEIVKNLLDFSRSKAGIIEDLDIGKILRETLTISENQITVNNIKLQVEIADNLPPVQGNREALQQVFINLLTNAVHAMPDGGEIVLRADRDIDRKIVISVRDTGYGIAEEHLPYIFDPFFTTKKVGKGTGLGLSVSYGIIQKHGGRITVVSSPGKGSMFTVMLPFKEETIDA
jgi:signal transduction histidine kinase